MVFTFRSSRCGSVAVIIFATAKTHAKVSSKYYIIGNIITNRGSDTYTKTVIIGFEDSRICRIAAFAFAERSAAAADINSYQPIPFFVLCRQDGGHCEGNDN